MAVTNITSSEQTVVFQLADETYGVEIFRVNEIIRLREITPVPKTETHIRGLVNLRGKTIPVIDLRVRFHLAPSEHTENARIIVVDSEAGTVGIIVDAVREVITLEPEEIDPAPHLVSDESTEFVRGVAKHETGLITLIDLDKALVA
jgi:purine-binding chemotaxis protein CheW